MNEFHEEDEEFFCRFTFGQFVSLALLEIVALFFAFYLGSRYGPALLGREQAPAIDHLSAVETVKTVEPKNTLPGAVNYTFPDELTKKKVPSEGSVPPSEVTKPAEKPVTPKPTVSVSAEKRKGYSIQVGSYRQAGGAAEKVNLWQARGYDAFLSIGEVPNSGTWYRVRIGSFKSRDTARSFLNQLTKRENVKGIIVRSSS